MTKILLADDSVTIQKVVELTFSDEASQVVAVSDGATAFEKAQMDRPDIILSDVIMPGMNGYEFCYKIKSDPGLKDIPFLFLKGTFESFDEEKAKQCGANGYIVKPFESQELINKVKELITRSSSPEAPSPAQEAPSVQPEVPAPSPPAPPAASPPAPPPPSPPMPQAAMMSPAEIQPAPAAPPAGEAGPGDAGIEDIAPPPPAAEDNLFEEAAEEKNREEDLWSEVSLRDTKAPLVEDNVLEEESFWGTSEEMEGSPPAEEPSAAVAGENFIEEVEEAEIMDLTEEAETPAAPPPPSSPTPVEAEELFEPFVPPEAIQVAPEPEVAEIPVAPPAAQASPAPSPEPEGAITAVPPPAPVTDAPAAAAPRTGGMGLEDVLGSKIEEAVRAHLGPAIGETAARIVEEVAWEVIPDLAESMIRNEIERIRREAGGKEGA